MKDLNQLFNDLAKHTGEIHRIVKEMREDLEREVRFCEVHPDKEYILGKTLCMECYPLSTGEDRGKEV